MSASNDRATIAEGGPEEVSNVASRIRQLIDTPQREGVVFQSVIVACLRTIDRVRQREESVSQASISLAQQDKLDVLLAELETVAGVLESALTSQGRRMLDLSENDIETAEDSRWWYALSEAIQELESGSECMASLVGNQPRGTDVRRMAGSIVRLLHKHHAQLVIEAEEWMS